MGESWIGVDIGATRTKLVHLESAGEVLDRRDIASRYGSADELLAAVESTIQAWLRPAQGVGATALGVVVPGLVDRAAGRVLRAPNLDELDDCAIVTVLQRATGLRVELDNDANAAGLAEARMGAAVGCDSAVCLTVGTGVGGAIIKDGRLWRGHSGMAGELGRLMLDAEAEQYLEEGVCAAAVEIAYRRRSGGAAEDIDAAAVFRLAEEGDVAAQQALARCGERIGVGLAVLVNLFNPQRIVVGGGVAGAGEWLLGPARREGRRRAWEPAWNRCEVVAARLGAEAGAIGAALLCDEEDAGAAN
jgi:glucokinase